MKGHPSGWSFLFTLIQLYIRYGIFVNIEKNELHTIHMNRYSSLFIREYFCAPAENRGRKEMVNIMRVDVMKINNENVEFVVKDLGYNYGDPIRNGTIVEISSEESFCRYIFVSEIIADVDSLFPGMEMGYYFPSITYSDGKHPSPPVLYMLGVGPSEDGKHLYVKDSWWSSFEEYHFKTRWEHVHRYWTSYNMCKMEGVKFHLECVRPSANPAGIPQIYNGPRGKEIRVQDADLDGKIKDAEYFGKLIELIDQLKGE